MCFDGRKPEADALMRAAREADRSRCGRCGSTNTYDQEACPPIRCCRDCGMRATVAAAPPPTPATPAICPACSSMDVVRVMGGPSWWACPNCDLEWGHAGAEAGTAAVPADAPTTIEDRGTPVWVWRDDEGWHSFWRLPRGVERVEVSAPIGWRLRPDPADGVALASVFGDRLTALAVLHHAERGEGGFRVRGRENVG